MGLGCGIVGLPNVGKSTLFAALSGQHVAAENYPFCTIEPNKGLVPVPDERLSKLSNLIQPDTTTPTIVQFVDVAGLVKGASRGEGLGNQFLANLRECTALVHIIRCFEDENIAHTEGMPNPLRDKDIIDTELQLKDIETVSKRLSKTQKVAKSGDKELKKEVALLQKYLAHLEKGHSLRTLNIDENTRAHFKDLTLLTEKPVLYVANVAEKDLPHGNPASARLGDIVAQAGAHLLVLSAATEAQIAQLPQEDQQEFLRSYGLEAPCLHTLIHRAYAQLGLITFFTAGKKEVRAWPIASGTRAPQAAGSIHSDFEKGFIKAETIRYSDYIRAGSEQACKEQGLMRTEGKDYVVQDGDVMHFRHHV